MSKPRDYNRVAALYDLLDLPFEYGRYRAIRRQLFQGVSGTVLDAGVGTGRNMPFYPPGAEVTGIDLSAQMLARARKRQASLGIQTELEQGDVRATGFANASFDYVIATFVFCVLSEEDQMPALRELKRICRTNGEIRLLEYTYSANPFRRFIMRLWAPWVRLMYGAAFDRDTEQYIEPAGLALIEKHFVYKDMIKLLVLRHRKAVALAATALFLLGAAPISAADLAGECCADLEERIAELEATTARKGNRKVSLTLSGYITKQIMFWDDGEERNAYITDMGPTQATNIRFSGSATIEPGWTAGYLIRIQDLTSNPMQLSQDAADGGSGLNVQISYWYLESEQLGKVSVGKNMLASKSTGMFTDLSGTQIIANYVLFDGNAFFLRQGDKLLSLRWGDFGYCYSQQRPWGGDCDGIVMLGVRYDSPSFAGFSMSASFGVDDDWEVAGRYRGDVGGFKVALGIGYSVNTDEYTQPPPVTFDKDSDFFQAGGYLQHLETGLFLHAIYGAENNHDAVTIRGGFTVPDTHQWYLKGGIRKQWFSLGHTVLYGEYAEYTDQLSPAALNAGATASEFSRWGLGAVQELDAAAMSLWLKYRQQGVSITGGGLGDIDDFRYTSVGALINF